ncbi:MAG: 2-succinyl-5-enolpyruvyl-6-hydroxy-3-cyclohexene-1-carboxylic-acid synthase, partial [Chromatiales bacterium]|nr:2-succinyl-5-enolpyruvyl-6-hydroxy-3-cyclohexene-1-carboxylic-acid synthase [Chromatiales bacterium]
MEHADLNYAWGHAICSGLHALGVGRIVISPGSRSTPLALAAHRYPELQTQVILDERSAAFFALGAAKTSGQPVALIATSGTAISEWLPAVSEADLARVPLILLSADRPPELRQCGANQTMPQANLFDERCRFSMELPLPDEQLFQSACRYACQAVAASRWPLPGPAHLNIPLREPLTPIQFPTPDSLYPTRVSTPTLAPNDRHLTQIAEAISGLPGLIICGPESGAPLPKPQITQLAEALNAPLLADPLSNLRNDSHAKKQLISQYDLALMSDSFCAKAQPEWVLRFGAMPVSKQLSGFLSKLDQTRYILVDPHGRWPDPLHRGSELVQADPTLVASQLQQRVSPSPSPYLRIWQERQQSIQLIVADTALEEREVVEILMDQLPAEGLLFCGNSLPIRQLDWFHPGRERALTIMANRGVSGIDGNIATLLGMASTGDRPVVGMIGDLTLLHDIGSLAISNETLNAVILVLDNQGGGIFDHLPQQRLNEHEALFITPQQVDLAALARGFGVAYQSTTTA